MAMTIDSLERNLKKAYGSQLKYHLHRDAEAIDIFWSGFENYRDPEGDDSLRTQLVLGAGGEYLEIVAPNAFNASSCRHLGALGRVLLGVSMRTAVVQFAFDESDGEVRATAEIPLMDGTYTPKQLRATIDHLKSVIDQFHPFIFRAMESGVISFPDEGTIVRPTLEDGETDAGAIEAVDLGDAIRAALGASREAGRKLWANAVPARDVGRHG